MNERNQNSSFNRFPVLLRGAWFGLNRVFRERLRSLNITTAQYTAMRCLYENKGLNQANLAKRISTNKNNCSSLVNRLHEQKLIQKKVILNDRRNFDLRLTRRGENIFFKAENIAHNLQKEILDILPKNARKDLVSHLQKVTQSIILAD